MKGVVWAALLWVAEAIAARIRKGKPLPILVGAVCGAAAGVACDGGWAG